MTISRIAGIAACACLGFTTPVVHAQNAPASAAKTTKPLAVVSRQIDGKNVHGTRIEVEVKALSEGIKEALASNGITDSKFNNASVRWVNNVKVTLVVGYQQGGSDAGKPKVYQDVIKLKDAVTGGKSLADATKAGSIENYRYYKASATVLTLEANTPRSVFFYIPPEIVKRDNITNPRPDVAYVTLEVDGKEVPTVTEAGVPYTGTFGVLFSGALGGITKDRLDKVKEVADRTTRDTSGVMRPQNLITGFIDQDWARFSPDFVREDNASSK